MCVHTHTHTHTHSAQSLLFLPLIQSLEMSFSVPCPPLFYKVQAFWYPWLISEMLVSGSPGDSVVKKPPAKAGDTGLISGGGSSRMPLSSYSWAPQDCLCSGVQGPSAQAAITEDHALRARAPKQEKPLQWEAHAPQLENSPAQATREKAREATKIQHGQISKMILKSTKIQS